MSLVEAIEAAARRAPTALALSAGPRRVTYTDLAGATRRAAARLRAAGVRRGDRVAWVMTKGVDAVVAHLGVLAAGATLVPVNPGASRREVAAITERAAPRLAVVDATTRASCGTAIATLDGHALAAEDTAGDAAHGSVVDTAGDVPTETVPNRDDVAVLLFTSGTTGRPKGVPHRHRALDVHADALAAAWRWCAEDVLVHALPLFHVHGLLVALHGALRAGAATVLLERFDADAVLDAIAREHATLFMGVPTMYRRLVQARAPHHDVGSVRAFVCGSAPLPARTAVAFERAFGRPIVQRYGLTETGILTSTPIDAPATSPGVGHPLASVEIRLVPVEPGTEIRARGPTVFAGYWNDPEATRAAFDADGWFRTGDLGRRDGSGEIVLVGRCRELIITGGFNVAPREVEEVIEEHEDVLEAAVIGLPDDDLGEVVAAAVVPRDGTPASRDEWLARCAARLARYKRPRRWLELPDLPRNAMGKVDRHELRRRADTFVACELPSDAADDASVPEPGDPR